MNNGLTQKPDMKFWGLWNLSFGFFGVQIAYALQSANISRIFATLGADPHNLSYFWILPPLMGILVQPIVGTLSDKTWCRFGRRIPYLFIGAAIAVFVMCMLPNAGSLGLTLGAAMIFNKSILSGKHGHNATIEHIVFKPGKKDCYCGKKGCAETLCSINALLEGFEDSLDLFFKNARKSGSREALRWQQYLEDLAIIINNIHLIYDTDFILGGYLAAYLNQDDVDVLYNHIATMTPFEAYRDYIYISKMPKHGITIGAALIYIKDFLDNKIKDEF